MSPLSPPPKAADKTKAVTKFSVFDYQAWFNEPIFEPARLFTAITPIYRTLLKWNISAQDVKYPGGATNPTDTLVTLQLVNNHYALNLSLAGMSFKAEYVDWSQASVITEIIETSSMNMKTALGVEFAKYQLQIVLQLVLEGKSIKELTKNLASPFVHPPTDVDFYGLLLQAGDVVFMLDKSAINPNGIFVRITHTFKGGTSMPEMAKVLYEDESWLANTLGIEIV